MNRTVATLTARTLLGRRRVLLLLLLPVLLLVLALVLRLTVSAESRAEVAVALLGVFALATVVPLLSLIAGTGAIGGEIDDGSIVYLLSKPLSRHVIAITKFLVAAATTTAFGAVPVLLAGLILVGSGQDLAVAFALGALAAGLSYCAVFLLLAVLTRNAVVVGLIYALVWESLVGSVVPGAQVLSIQQWAGALSRAVVGAEADSLSVLSAVSPAAAVPLLAGVTVGAVALAGHRLRSLRVTGDE